MNSRTVILRAPSPKTKNGQEKMGNIGVGFIDSVTLESGEKRTAVHFLPEQPLSKDETIMVFPGRGRELPIELVNHTETGNREPGYVLYHKDQPIGSGWLHEGKKKYIVVKINKPIPDNQEDKRLTLFPRFAQLSSGATPGGQR